MMWTLEMSKTAEPSRKSDRVVVVTWNLYCPFDVSIISSREKPTLLTMCIISNTTLVVGIRDS